MMSADPVCLRARVLDGPVRPVEDRSRRPPTDRRAILARYAAEWTAGHSPSQPRGDSTLRTPAPGPPPFTPVGGVQAILPGVSQTGTVNLDAGTYVLICFIPNAEGVPHFALGMVRELTVN